MPIKWKTAIITLSDKGYAGEREDKSGPLIREMIERAGYEVTEMVLLPDEQSCDLVKRRFLNDPVVIYKGVVALLTGSYENVGALLEPAEDLPRG